MRHVHYANDHVIECGRPDCTSGSQYRRGPFKFTRYRVRKLLKWIITKEAS